jgi:hypothetical protein
VQGYRARKADQDPGVRLIRCQEKRLFGTVEENFWKMEDNILYLLFGTIEEDFRTMEDNIFYFKDQEALQIQDNSICEALYDDFWTGILCCDEKLRLQKQDLLRIKDSCSLYWHARYASVVLVRRLDSTYSSIALVGLDGWKSVVHASLDGRESIAVPDVSSPAFYELGRSPTNAVEEILKMFNVALKESEVNNTGNRRGQNAGHQGNQKTPSFARTVLWQVMNDTEDRQMIQGGTTDVGMHTGCVRRNTSFPLVLSAVHTILRLEGEEADEVFNKCVSAFLLGCLKELAPLVMAFNAGEFNRVVTIIREIEVYLRSVEDVDFVDYVVAVVEEHHTRLLELRPGGDTESTALLLNSVPVITAKLRPPLFPKIPDLTSTHDPQSQMSQAKSDAQKNLAWSDLLSTEFSGKLQDAWVLISRLNKIFWDIAKQLEDKDVDYDISDLRNCLALFSRQIALVHKESLKAAHVMTVVLSSNELLATWICFCWAHRTAEEKHPLFGKYGAALDPADLRHIVLDDKGAIAAVKCVRRFLVARLEKPSRPFRTKTDTLELALDYGSSSKLLRDLHSEELHAANELIEQRWKKIAKTQLELSELDSKLKTAKRDLGSAWERSEISEHTDFDYDRRSGQKVWHQLYYDISKEKRRCQNIVNSLEKKIQVLEIKPADLKLGLPRETDRSLQWLFFMRMPTEFRDLSALAQLAQSKLWKKAPVEETLTENTPSLV